MLEHEFIYVQTIFFQLLNHRTAWFVLIDCQSNFFKFSSNVRCTCLYAMLRKHLFVMKRFKQINSYYYYY